MEILNNLIENAIKYTPHGEVIVDIRGAEDHVVISIKDSGIGIPTEDIQHLFQKFYRVDDQNTRVISGTGLGLYLCRRLAEIMGGRIWVESTYGSGSTFYLELPRITTQQADALKNQEQFKAQQDASLPSAGTIPSDTNSIDTTYSLYTPSTPPSTPAPATPKVPRSQALTPDQIAAYVAKQRELASSLSSREAPITPPPRNQPVSIPIRDQNEATKA
jgi:hypothetical protein